MRAIRFFAALVLTGLCIQSAVAETTTNTDWQLIPTEEQLWTVITSNGHWYAAGQDGAILVSTNGTDWKKEFAGSKKISCLWASGDEVVAASREGALFRRKPDGTWIADRLPVSMGAESNFVTYWRDSHGAEHVITGAAGLGFARAKGATAWHPVKAMGGIDLLWNVGDLVRGFSPAGRLLSSNDGGNAFKANPPITTSRLYALGGTKTALYAGGEGGVLLHSRDAGKTWKPESSGTKNDITGIAATRHSAYAAVGDAVLVSRDGQTWSVAYQFSEQKSASDPPNAHSVRAIAIASSGQVVAVGNGTILVYTPPAAPLKR